MSTLQGNRTKAGGGARRRTDAERLAEELSRISRERIGDWVEIIAMLDRIEDRLENLGFSEAAICTAKAGRVLRENPPVEDLQALLGADKATAT